MKTQKIYVLDIFVLFLVFSTLSLKKLIFKIFFKRVRFLTCHF